MEQKTDIRVKITNGDGNAFAIIGKVAKVLRKEKHDELAREFTQRAYESKSYEQMLGIAQEYVKLR